MDRDGTRPLRDGKTRPLDAGSLGDALDFIAEDHMREREICELIDRLVANAGPDVDDCAQVVSFLKYDLPQHLADEETDLFPMMLKRCAPEDEIQKVIKRLQSDHGHALSDTPAIIALLGADDALSAGFSEEQSTQLTEFATHARRHLTLENAIILPIARARLTKEDLETMKRHMLERRGLEGLEGGPQC